MINHIVLLFRHKIHILAMLNYFRTVEKVEQKIAYQKDKLKLHFEKWDPVRQYIHIRSTGASNVSREKVKGEGDGQSGTGR